MEKNTRTTVISCGAIAAVVIIIVFGTMMAVSRWLWRQAEGIKPHLGINEKLEIGLSATQIASIRDIGQWEFLSVTDEEMVDTTRVNMFGDDHLVNIYHGTLRLGINLSQLSEDDIETRGDTVIMNLPKVTLLDDHFIDDARTTVFHETGTWSATDREALYERGKRKMISRTLTKTNLARAQELAEQQMRQLLQAMGYQEVVFR